MALPIQMNGIEAFELSVCQFFLIKCWSRIVMCFHCALRLHARACVCGVVCHWICRKICNQIPLAFYHSCKIISASYVSVYDCMCMVVCAALSPNWMKLINSLNKFQFSVRAFALNSLTLFLTSQPSYYFVYWLSDTHKRFTTAYTQSRNIFCRRRPLSSAAMCVNYELDVKLTQTNQTHSKAAKETYCDFHPFHTNICAEYEFWIGK